MPPDKVLHQSHQPPRHCDICWDEQCRSCLPDLSQRLLQHCVRLNAELPSTAFLPWPQFKTQSRLPNEGCDDVVRLKKMCLRRHYAHTCLPKEDWLKVLQRIGHFVLPLEHVNLYSMSDWNFLIKEKEGENDRKWTSGDNRKPLKCVMTQGKNAFANTATQCTEELMHLFFFCHPTSQWQT